MKKIIVIIFLFAAVTISAQDIPDDDTTSKPAITAIGKPDGAKAEMKIGKDGGSFSSTDGKVKLIIPEGAVSKKTTFSIQPVNNLMPNGNGKAYRLEPSGIEFQKPVELVFHYDPEESEDSAQLLMGMAMQDDKGQWYGLDEFTLDTVAKTISGNINHFSTWATFDKLKLRSFFGEASIRIKVRKTEKLGIVGVFERSPKELERDRKSEGKEGRIERYFGGLSRLRIWKRPQKGIWRVNGITKGNAEFGTLEKGEVNESDLKWNEYTAPANVPDQNPVTISVELVGSSYTLKSGKSKTIVNNPRLSIKVLIYDNAYEVKMTSYLKDETVGGGYITYEDRGSFVVELSGKKTKIIERLNKNIPDIYKLEGGKCTIKQLKPGSGYLHMRGVAVITVTPATSTEPARVSIQFRPTPLILPLIRFTCIEPDPPPTIFTNVAMNAMWAKMMSAYPHCIEFTAKEGEEEWEVYEKEFNIPEGEQTQTNDRKLVKYIIRKLKGDEGF